MKPLKEILAVNGNDIVAATEVMRVELEKQPPLQASELLASILNYVEDSTRYMLGLFLDLANDVGALPDGREQAGRATLEVLAYYRMVSVYERVFEMNQ